MTALPQAALPLLRPRRAKKVLYGRKQRQDHNGAWGELLPGSFDNVGLALRFIGGYGVRTDLETGLVSMRHRWYDATLQRFISRDPIGLRGGANLYAYPLNPLKYIDPSGLVWVLDGPQVKDLLDRIRKETCLELILNIGGLVTAIKTHCPWDKCKNKTLRKEILNIIKAPEFHRTTAGGRSSNILFGGFMATGHQLLDMDDFDRAYEVDSKWASAMLTHELAEMRKGVEIFSAPKSPWPDRVEVQPSESNAVYKLSHERGKSVEREVMGATRTREGFINDFQTAKFEYTDDTTGKKFGYEVDAGVDRVGPIEIRKL